MVGWRDVGRVWHRVGNLYVSQKPSTDKINWNIGLERTQPKLFRRPFFNVALNDQEASRKRSRPQGPLHIEKRGGRRVCVICACRLGFPFILSGDGWRKGNDPILEACWKDAFGKFYVPPP